MDDWYIELHFKKRDKALYCLPHRLKPIYFEIFRHTSTSSSNDESAALAISKTTLFLQRFKA